MNYRSMIELALYYRDIKKVSDEYTFWYSKAEKYKSQFNQLYWVAAEGNLER